MSYTVTVSGTTFTVGMSSVDYAVTLSQVGQQGVAGARWQGAWTLSTDYAVNDVVSNGGSSYICILAHTAASTDEPGVGVNTATYWAILAQGGADGADGTGFTGGSYNAADGTVTFTSNDGLGFSTGDLRGTDGQGFTGGSYNVSTGVVTFTSDDGLGFSTGDLRGADGLSVNWQGDWALSTAYALNDSVAHNGSSYICIQAHTSSATDEPGVGANTATYWGVLAEKGVDGTGSGTVTSVDITPGAGIDATGGPITASGSITVSLNAATAASLALADSAVQPADLATVATTGAYSDLSGLPTLGTAAATDVADYATAAQGALADSALQSVSGTTDEIVVTGGDTISLATAVTTSLGLADSAVQPGDLATVATTGAYSDLSGLPTLGTAAATDATDYATAAQGALADSALQPTGTVTLTGGFDSDAEALGTITTGTVTPEVDGAGEENFKTLTANGAFTLAPPSTSSNCTIIIQVTNGASAGTITTSGFTIVNGDTYETTDGNDYLFHIKKVGSFTSLTIEALQ